jgi:hypothetical protein
MKSDNQLIAEFLGFKFNSRGICQNEVFYTAEEKHPLCYIYLQGYHSRLAKFSRSWDWLMPVVEKIAEMYDYVSSVETRYCNNYSNRSYYFSIITKPYSAITMRVYNNKAWKNWERGHSGVWFDTEIEAIYRAVVEFIKWYNKRIQYEQAEISKRKPC